MKLSILTPTVPSRSENLARLCAKIQAQIGDHPVEHLTFGDNRRRTIGAKRQALQDIAQGEYIAFVDDDDDVSDDYVSSILAATTQRPDVITFRQAVEYNGQTGEVEFGINNVDQPFAPGGLTLRAPWHVCAWRRRLVSSCMFGECNYGEDVVWARQARHLARTSTHINKVILTYRTSAETTLAPENAKCQSTGATEKAES